MTIHDVRLPVDIERGAKGGAGFKTTVITLSSGQETRNQEWQRARAQWDIGYGIQSLDSLRAVDAFFRARRGRAFGFRFKDWSDYAATLEPVAAVTGDTTKRQLVKTYADTANAYTRLITRPVVGTLKVYVDTLLDETYTLLDGGILDWASDPGTDVLATFEFDVPVRFDTDQFGLSQESFLAGAISSLPIVELRE